MWNISYVTKNKLHNRIPALLWDDFGAHSNKARTQHNRAWDSFKGDFNVLGTRLGVLIATMVSPTEPTQQLQEKYTHEVWVYSRGKAKYDRFYAVQDYKGFRAKRRKHWIDDFPFWNIPKEVFIEYDQIRQELADEVLLSIKDTLVDNDIERVTKKLAPSDLQLRQLIQDTGPVYYKKVYDDFGKPLGKKVLTRLKARGIISPMRDSSGYTRYDMNEIGFEIIRKQSVATE